MTKVDPAASNLPPPASNSSLVSIGGALPPQDQLKADVILASAGGNCTTIDAVWVELAEQIRAVRQG